jgi:hypothetical protein
MWGCGVLSVSVCNNFLYLCETTVSKRNKIRVLFWIDERMMKHNKQHDESMMKA